MTSMSKSPFDAIWLFIATGFGDQIPVSQDAKDEYSAITGLGGKISTNGQNGNDEEPTVPPPAAGIDLEDLDIPAFLRRKTTSTAKSSDIDDI